MSNQQYTIGLDFGSDSVRALIVCTTTGAEISTSVKYYPRWRRGKYCVPQLNQFRQHPKDYIETMEAAVREALSTAPLDGKVIGIGVDTTGSTPCPVDEKGVPLALLPGFEENPNAMFHLWKDHTAIKEAEAINRLNTQSDTDYLKYVGGVYSAEWYWAKIARTHKVDLCVKETAFTWVEHCDWIPFLVTGGTDVTKLKRSVCAAGHKALWHEDYQGIPPLDFLAGVDDSLQEIHTGSLAKTYTSDKVAGTLSKEWADRLGLTTDTVVAVGAYDAHMGAVGGEIEPGYLSKVIGTSTCDIMVAPLKEHEHLVKGICGQVKGSVIPGMLGLEAGQSAFGDVYAWYKDLLMWPLQHVEKESPYELIEEIGHSLIQKLAEEAAKIEPNEGDIVALDWMNGRRTPDANQALKGAISGINLGTDASRIFKSLVEATCFGARRIAERFIEEGIEIKGIIALGGVAKKSSYVMQILADIMQMPIKVGRSDQTCALGAAMFAAVAAGKYAKVEDAMNKMGAGFETVYNPDPSRAGVYNTLYEKYCQLGNVIESISTT